MPIRTESIELDISSCCSCAGPVCARQGDEGMVLQVTVLDSGEAVDLTGLTATLEYNNPQLVQVTGTVSGGTASFELPSAALSGAGTWHPYVRLSQGDSDVASTGSFVLRVSRAADLSAQQAEGYVPQLDQALSTATAASEAAQQAATQAAQAVEDAAQAVTDAQGAVSAANSAAQAANAAASAASDAAAAARGNVLTGTETGRVVAVDDAYAAKPREVRVKGRTVNNLWVNPTGLAYGVTASETVDGALQVSGTATSAATINTGYIYSLRQGSQITARCDRAPVAGMVLAVYFFDTDGSSVGYFDAITSSQTQASYTVPSGMAYAQCSVYVPSGVTASGTYRVMLVEGSSAPDCFVAPGLQSMGELSVVEAGKNLFRVAEGTKEGVTLADEGGGYRLQGAASTGIGFFRTDASGDIPSEPIIPDGQYVLSAWFDGTVSGGEGVKARVRRSDGGYYDAELDITSSRSSKALSLNDVASFELCVTQGTTADATVYVQLELGSAATAYAPPSTTSTPIDLDGRELRSLSDGTADELVIGMDGSCEMIQRVEAVMFDGSTGEPWIRYTNGGANGWLINVAFDNANLGRYDVGLMCDRLPVYDTSPNGRVGYGVTSNGVSLWVTFPDGVNSDIESFRAWLASGPMTVLASVGEAQSADLEAVTLPALPAPDATVWADTGAIPTDATLTYERDVTIAFAKLEAEVAALKVSQATN